MRLATFALAAAPPTIQTGAGVGYLLSGGSRVPGQPGAANPRGGAALVAFARIEVPVAEILDLEATFSPMVVTPYTLEQLGLVGAHDLGVALHPPGKPWALNIGATWAPMFGYFCNPKFCDPKHWIASAGGGAASLRGALARSPDGRGLQVDLAARLLYASPRAWTDPTYLSEQERGSISRIMFMGGLSATWVF